LESSQHKKTDTHKYLHEKLGENWIKEFFTNFNFEDNVKKLLKEVCKDFQLLEDCEKIEPIKVILSAFHHHAPEKAGEYKFFAQIYQRADFISAAERDKKQEDTLSPKEKRLHSIFENIEIFEEKPKKDWVYPIKPLEVDENTTARELEKIIFPFPLSEQPGKPSEVKRESRELFEELYGDYEPLLRAFGTAFKEALKGISDISKLTAKVYYLVL
jgi:molybdopterin converting factor small subunit